MDEQPTALRLADALEQMPGYDWNKNYCEAAAELRRLVAQRDELLEALKELVQVSAHLDACQATVEQARAAIAKAQGETK